MNRKFSKTHAPAAQSSGSRNGSKFKLPAWAYLLLVVFAVGTISLRLWIVRTTYSVHQADREIRELQLDRERAELKTAGMKSPLKLETLARHKFKLAQPTSQQVIHMDLREPAQAKPEAKQ